MNDLNKDKLYIVVQSEFGYEWNEVVQSVHSTLELAREALLALAGETTYSNGDNRDRYIIPYILNSPTVDFLNGRIYE